MAAKELVLATANANKVREIRAILPLGFNLIDLRDVGIDQTLPETTGTIPGNARQKAETVYQLTGKNCLADDSGLLVPALDGAPGVDSAMYAGLPRDDKRNMEKLLREVEGKAREAKFLCALALCWEGETVIFEGELNGKINHSPSGNYGFGYDPVFIPENQERTLAEMTPDEKNRISHRKRALEKLLDWLHNLP